MAQPYVGQILLFAGNFAPVGYIPCDGRQLSIADNPTLFNLIGTTYGGDGQTTFGVPDLRGRASVGMGTGAGLPTFPLGTTGGSEAVTLTSLQMPSHIHTAGSIGSGAGGGVSTPSSSSVFADQQGATTVNVYAPYASSGQTALTAATVGVAGQSLPHENRQPFLAITICIAAEGVYPSQG